MLTMSHLHQEVEEYTSHEGYEFLCSDSFRDHQPQVPSRTKSKTNEFRNSAPYRIGGRRAVQDIVVTPPPTSATSAAATTGTSRPIEFEVQNPYSTTSTSPVMLRRNSRWSLDSSRHSMPLLGMSSRRMDVSIRSGCSFNDTPPSIPRRLASEVL